MEMRLSLACLLALGCDAGAPPKPAPPPPEPPMQVASVITNDHGEPRPPVKEDLARYLQSVPGSGAIVATFETNYGNIHCELFPDKAPLAVANFIGLATGRKAWRDPTSQGLRLGVPFYDGLIFHRVIPEFMIQGGDPQGRGTGGPGYQFVNEDSSWSMPAGALAMANAGRDTNGSQFFIMESGDRQDLAHQHTVFGQCVDLEVIKRIARVPRAQNDKPTQDVTIEHVTFSRGMDPWH